VVPRQDVLHGDEVAERFTHLLAVDREKAVVHPAPREGRAVRGLALSDLIFVMREDEVFASAVDVEVVSQVLRRHRRALDVPPRSTLSPRARPTPRFLAAL